MDRLGAAFLSKYILADSFLTLLKPKLTQQRSNLCGRGLRLCVNQDGERVEDKHINSLHVMANESFSEFAETLQREIEDDTGMKFGVLQLDLFAGMVYEEHVERDSFMDLRTREQLKIHCGKKHFEALENGIEMQVATDWHEIKARV